MKNAFGSALLKNYSLPLLSFIVVIGLIPLVIIPQLNQIAADSKVVNKNAAKLSQVKAKADELEKLANNQDELNSKLKNAEKILPVSKAIAPLMLGIQQIAINNNLQVSTIKLQPGKVATTSAGVGLKTQITSTNNSANQQLQNFNTSSTDVVFQMQMTGTTTSLQNFLSVLEKGRRLLILKQFEVQQTKDGAYTVEVFFSAPFSPLPKISDDQIVNALPSISDSDNQLLEKLSSLLSNEVTTTDISPGEVGTQNPFR